MKNKEVAVSLKPGIQAMQLNFIFMPRLAHDSMQYKEYISVNV